MAKDGALIVHALASAIMRREVELPDPVAAVFITEQLVDRMAGPPDFFREKLAFQNLAQVMINPTRSCPGW
jgi:hypothetical protein